MYYIYVIWTIIVSFSPMPFNSLVPRRFEMHLRWLISKIILVVDGCKQGNKPDKSDNKPLPKLMLTQMYVAI